MRAVIYTGTEVQYVEDYPTPARGPGESLVEIRLAAICNTDKEVAKGYKPDFRGVMGHEFVGVVLESDRPELRGRRVVGELNAGCGDCVYCNTGREKHCLRRRVPGLQDKDGCFCEVMTMRDDLLHVVPDGLADEDALFTEPLAAAVQLREQAHIKPSQPVGLVGDGKLAYLCGQVLSLCGASVTVFGKHRDKLEAFSPFATTSLDADEGHRFELVVEASGSPSGFETAVRLVRSGGTILLKSTYAGAVTTDLSRLVVREITLTGSRCGPFEPALRLLEQHKIQLPPVRFYSLDGFREAFSSTAPKAGFRI